jgi:hypothetical protein
MQEYKHRPLDTKSSEFRLLRIEKSIDETSPINLTLRHAYVNEEEGKFNALSYAWGDESPTYEVHIDDGVTRGSFHVRQNLYDYLCTARSLSDNWTTEWIWIDQVCIDQSHHAEKCHQVGQMGQLYSTANATISWPGRLREESDMLVKENDEEFESFIYRLADDPLENYGFDAVANAQRLAKGPLHDLIRSPYWSRTWIVQEIVLARQRHVLINEELWDLGDLYEAIRRLDQWCNNGFKRSWPEMVMDKIHDLVVHLYWIHHIKPKEPLESWDQVFIISGHTECSVPFDRIYALMGLLHERRRLQPNYDTTEKELLRNILRSELAEQMETSKIDYPEVLNIIERWSGELKFKPVRPLGWLDKSSQLEYFQRAEYNVRVVFNELGITLPAESSATSENVEDSDLIRSSEGAGPGNRDRMKGHGTASLHLHAEHIAVCERPATRIRSLLGSLRERHGTASHDRTGRGRTCC